MAQDSTIEWTDATWNPVTGCTKVSAGCKFCYAERMAKRLQAMGKPQYAAGFQLTLQPHALKLPYKWVKPRFIFVNSMSDLFHRDVPLDYIRQVFKVMNDCAQHQFQVLTKRPERVAECADSLEWTPNIWMGTSVEDERVVGRIDHLRSVPAQVRFLSIEPLIGPLPTLLLDGIDWVIVGGESGPGARPMAEDWVIAIQEMCMESGVPFFFKQWGGQNKKKTGRLLLGRTWDEMPVQLTY
ncbi:MAG: phage Gp37/Gp68 family protein [Candidatus Hydrogenedentes bacterium]|nr:phage Gp37/Gp68 family protein [Candidatus Hydrogenedentota bacterium]